MQEAPPPPEFATCGECRAVLNLIERLDGDRVVSQRWEHGHPPSVPHEPVPVFDSGPVTTVCDFCSSATPAWRVQTPNFTLEFGPVKINDYNGWAACDVCKGFIDRDDWLGLSNHAYVSLGLDNPGFMVQLLELHNAVRQAMTGIEREA